MVIGGLRGCARGLGGLVDELDLVPKLWMLVRPHVQRYASAARSGARHAEARASALHAFRAERGSATCYVNPEAPGEMTVTPAGPVGGAMVAGLVMLLAGTLFTWAIWRRR